MALCGVFLFFTLHVCSLENDTKMCVKLAHSCLIYVGKNNNNSRHDGGTISHLF